MIESIFDILVRRDGLTAEEASRLIRDAHQKFNYYLDEGDVDAAENICQEFFGLEPDYLYEFI